MTSSTDKRVKVDFDQKTDLYVLTISEATADDAGDYMVKATNKFGTFRFTVTVLVGKPEGATIVESKRTMTSVTETIVDGEVVDRVEKEDVQVEKFDDVDSKSSLKLTTTSKKEVVEEEAVSAEKVEKVQSVKTEDDKSPKIEVPPKPVSVDEGETIRLTCKVTG